MRLLIAAGIFPPDIGGPASYVPEISASLVERGHDVHVVCLSDSAEPDERVYPFAVTRIVRGGIKFARMAATMRTLTTLGRGRDALYANGLNLESHCAGSLLGVPVVHKIVGDLAWERARNRGWFDGTLDDYQRARKDLRLKLLDERRSLPLRRAAFVVTPSTYLGNTIAGWGVPQTAIRIVRNALPRRVPDPIPVLVPSFDGRTILTICRLVPWKGVEGLIDVVAGLQSIRLLVIGDGPSRSTLEAQARSRGIADRVIWLGVKSPGEIQAVFRMADLFVLNSSYEGLPHVILEAMRARVPVVATAAGGTPEVVVDGLTGRLVPTGSVEALRAAIAGVLACPDAARAMAARALHHLEERFGYTTMVDETERALLEAVEARARG
jgi:glycosyltransferase involved in cell wall biosynthesis